jgi:hypothetical protein
MTISLSSLIKSNIKKPDLDKSNNVSLFCGNYNTSQTTKNVQHPTNIRGYVFHNDKLFFQGFPTSVELEDSMLDTLNLNDCRVFEAHEGTLIRVFHINGTWYTSTNRKLDAMKSKWAAKHETFGHRFTDAIREIIDDQIYEENEENEEYAKGVGHFNENLQRLNDQNRDFLTDVYNRNLNPDYKYMFLLKPSHEERIVCKAEPRPTIYHVGTFNENNILNLDDAVSLDGNIVDKPKEFKFMSVDEIKNRVEKVNIDHHQGFILIKSGEEDIHYKYSPSKYKYLFGIRGNIPSLKFRYLQLRRYGVSQERFTFADFKSFLELYNFDQMSKQIESDIYDVCCDLHQKYIMYYVDKKHIDISEFEKDILQNIIHTAYVETRLKTTISRINDMLTNGKPSIINHLLKQE